MRDEFHWQDRLRPALVTYAIVMAATFAVLIAALLIQGYAGPRNALILAATMIAGDVVIVAPIVLLALALSGPMGRRMIVIALASIVIGAAETAWDSAVRVWLGAAYAAPLDFGARFVGSISINVYHTAMVGALVAFQAAYLDLRREREARDAAEARERAATLAALRLQINPHFLLNAMNALSSLVMIGRQADAETMIERLTSYFRNSLTVDPAEIVTIEDEIDATETYLDIERVRFGERLRVVIDLPDALRGALVPPLLLQPLVENSMKYAVARSLRPVTVTIAVGAEGDRLRLVVADDSPPSGFVAGGTGIGLANVRDRLALRYGPSAEIATRHDERGFATTIRLPLQVQTLQAAA